MFEIEFDIDAKSEWDKLPSDIRHRFKNKLIELKEAPHRADKKLRGRLKDCYKIRVSKYRLVYKVEDYKLIILVLSVSNRDKLKAYKIAEKRIP